MESASENISSCNVDVSRGLVQSKISKGISNRLGEDLSKLDGESSQHSFGSNFSESVRLAIELFCKLLRDGSVKLKVSSFYFASGVEGQEGQVDHVVESESGSCDFNLDRGVDVSLVSIIRRQVFSGKNITSNVGDQLVEDNVLPCSNVDISCSVVDSLIVGQVLARHNLVA